MKAVHPHMRGEYFSSGFPAVRESGSSPHAWGIPPEAFFLCPGFRFIPTCVGNTLDTLYKLLPQQVHPHMRGEYWRCGYRGT